MDSNNKNKIVIAKSIDITLASFKLTKRGLEIIAELVPHRIHVPDDFPTINEALDHAVDGDIIELAEGIYREQLLITKPVELVGCETSKVIIESINSEPIITYRVDHGSSGLRNITIKGITTSEGSKGLEFPKGELEVWNCNFESITNSDYDNQSMTIILGTNSEYSEEDTQPDSIFYDCCFSNCGFVIGIRSTVDLYGCNFINSYIYAISFCEINSHHCSYRSSNFIMCDDANYRSNYDTYLEIKNLFFIDEGWVDAFSEAPWTAIFSHATIIAECLFARYFMDIDPEKGPGIRFVDSIVILTQGFYYDIRFRKDVRPYGQRKPEYEYERKQINWADEVFLPDQNNNLMNIPPFIHCQDPRLIIEHNNARLSPSSPAINSASDGANLGAWQGD
jgi:hypothetical protein